jgi:hypothetical protein
MHVKLNSIYKRTSLFIGDRTFTARMDVESIILCLTMRHLRCSKSTRKPGKSLEKVLWDTQPLLGNCESKVSPILWRQRKRSPKLGKLLQVFSEQSFASRQQLLKRILIRMTAIQYHLANKMTYKIKHCKWVAPRLSATPKWTRVTPSRSLSDLPHSLQNQGWKYIVMLNEAWLYFSNKH